MRNLGGQMKPDVSIGGRPFWDTLLTDPTALKLSELKVGHAAL